MKWNIIYVLTTSLLSISVIGCWPFAPPPPPPPPPPLHLFEDHYMRYQVPYDRGLTHMASQSSGETIHPMGAQVNHQFFFPISSMNPMPSMTYAEPEQRIYADSNNFDLGNTEEFVGFAPPEPPLMKVRHMNYRYRKRLRTHKPVEEEGFGHSKEVQKYSQRFNPSPTPRRYNVIDSRGEYQKRIPNSVNDKLEPKKVLTEEESHRQNLSTNKTDNKNDRKISNKAQDLQENGSQNKDTPNSIRPTVDMPIEVTSYELKSPGGGFTQVTEMLYDVENNPFKPPTSTPMATPVWRPSTPFLNTVTEESSVTQSPYLSSAYSETETGSTLKSQPINTAVTAKFNEITMSPVLSFTSPRNTMDPFQFSQPTTFTAEPTLPPTPPRLRTSVSPSDYYLRRSRKRFSTQKPSSTTPKSSARQNKAGLSGAAIAGIVIGSMVSIMLLAGTSLFVMYKNPFRRSLSPQRSADSLPNVRTNETLTRVHRWPPRRQRRL